MRASIACSGCRGCEPVCPSGVQYGRGLEAARDRITAARGVSRLTRLALWTLTTPGVSGFVYRLARLLRATGLPRLFAGWGRFRFGMGMLAATKGAERREKARKGAAMNRAFTRSHAPLRAFLFRGCVMEGLFQHVHEATQRTLGVNGFQAVEVPGQVCCGALHAHAGLLDAARALARTNVNAFGDGEEPIVVNSAGCGALMKEYGHLLGDARGERFGRRVRDVTELLAGDTMKGPVAGAPLDLHVAYDPPCHLLHAQGVAVPPLKLFAAIPLLELVPVPGAAGPRCCSATARSPIIACGCIPPMGPRRAAWRIFWAPPVSTSGSPTCATMVRATANRAAGLGRSKTGSCGILRHWSPACGRKRTARRSPGWATRRAAPPACVGWRAWRPPRRWARSSRSGRRARGGSGRCVAHWRPRPWRCLARWGISPPARCVSATKTKRRRSSPNGWSGTCGAPGLVPMASTISPASRL